MSVGALNGRNASRLSNGQRSTLPLITVALMVPPEDPSPDKKATQVGIADFQRFG